MLTSAEEVETLRFYRIRTDGILYALLDRWSSLDEHMYRYAQEHSEDLDLGIVENIYLP